MKSLKKQHIESAWPVPAVAWRDLARADAPRMGLDGTDPLESMRARWAEGEPAADGLRQSGRCSPPRRQTCGTTRAPPSSHCPSDAASEFPSSVDGVPNHPSWRRLGVCCMRVLPCGVCSTALRYGNGLHGPHMPTCDEERPPHGVIELSIGRTYPRWSMEAGWRERPSSGRACTV